MSERLLLPIIGWREWIVRLGLGGKFVSLRIDTGDRSSSRHAFDNEIFERDTA